MRTLSSVLIIMTIISYSLQKVRLEHSKLNEVEIMSEYLSDVLKFCPNNDADFIGVFKDSNVNRWSFTFPETASIINMQSSLNASGFQLPLNIFNSDLSSHKLHIFVMIATTPSNLKFFIKQIRSSPLWNPMATFIFLDSTTGNNGCNNAIPFLLIAWKANLISATVLCSHPNKGYVLYTFNPYTDYAPKPWKFIHNRIIEYETFNHTWALFRQKFEAGRTTCLNLTYDKSGNWGRFQMRGIAKETIPTLIINRNETGLKRLGGPDGITWRVLQEKLNFTLIVEEVNQTRYQNSTHDFLIHSIQQDFCRNWKKIFPHAYSAIGFLTRPLGFKTEQMKILHFMNPKLILAIFGIFVLTVIVMGIFVGRGILNAGLEAIRSLVGVAMIRLPRRNPPRIYLITVITLFLLTGSTFQSNLSAILTSTIPNRNIDTRTDLIASGYTLYIRSRLQNPFYEPELMSRVRTLSKGPPNIRQPPKNQNWDCSQHVLMEKNTACAADRARLIKLAYDKKLYLSKGNLYTFYRCFCVRENSAFSQRVHVILNRLSQGGFVEYWDEEAVLDYKLKLERVRARITSRQFRKLSKRDLAFAFYLLSFGLSASIIVFVVELVLKRRERRRAKEWAQKRVKFRLRNTIVQRMQEICRRKGDFRLKNRAVL